jgi:hypothetical protein
VTEQNATAATPKMPKTAADALALWDVGEAVPAFRVEEEESEQEAIYAAAFELIRDGQLVGGAPMFGTLGSSEFAASCAANKLSDREVDVAHSIAYVAIKDGWAKMVLSHTSYSGPRATHQITVRKG